MYTIKEAAARTGLSVPVLRAWERRYGIVSPTRTAGGYRVYDDADAPIVFGGISTSGQRYALGAQWTGGAWRAHGELTRPGGATGLSSPP